MMRKSWLAAGVVPVLGVLAVLLWPERPALLQFATVARGDVEQVVSNTRAGTVNACRRSRLSMPMGGRVERLHVDEGDHVRAGAVLLEIWNDDREAQLAQARAAADAVLLREQQACLQADQSLRDEQRSAQLEGQQLISKGALEQDVTRRRMADAACAAARADLGTARAQIRVQGALLEETRLRAPFAGVIAQVNGEPGEYVTPSPPGVATPPAVDLIDDSCLYVTAPIDEIDAAQVRTGLPVRITLDAFRDARIPGKVSRIAPYVLDKEKQARTVDVEVRFESVPDNVILLVGYSADVDIVLQTSRNVLRIPAESLIDGKAVLLLDAAGNRLVRREVTTGLANWTWVEITGGLAEGDRVVLSLDRPGAVEGAAVRVEPSP
ncbi:MAG: efflux RND transporter periplasmic adaptor subunit [Pseudomonadota bacterium]